MAVVEKVYTIEHYYACKVIKEVCGHLNDESPPECSKCQDYKRWKASGLMLSEWRG